MTSFFTRSNFAGPGVAAMAGAAMSLALLSQLGTAHAGGLHESKKPHHERHAYKPKYHPHHESRPYHHESRPDGCFVKFYKYRNARGPRLIRFGPERMRDVDYLRYRTGEDLGGDIGSVRTGPDAMVVLYDGRDFYRPRYRIGPNRIINVFGIDSYHIRCRPAHYSEGPTGPGGPDGPYAQHGPYGPRHSYKPPHSYKEDYKPYRHSYKYQGKHHYQENHYAPQKPPMHSSDPKRRAYNGAPRNGTSRNGNSRNDGPPPNIYVAPPSKHKKSSAPKRRTYNGTSRNDGPPPNIHVAPPAKQKKSSAPKRRTYNGTPRNDGPPPNIYVAPPAKRKQSSAPNLAPRDYAYRAPERRAISRPHSYNGPAYDKRPDDRPNTRPNASLSDTEEPHEEEKLYEERADSDRAAREAALGPYYAPPFHYYDD